MFVCVALAVTACGRPRPVRTTPVPSATEDASPRVTITAPRPGETLRAGDLVVTYSVAGLKLVVPAEAGKGEVHIDVFLDGDVGRYATSETPVPTGSDRIVHTTELRVTFKDVGPGPHVITALVTSKDHVSVKPRIWDSVSILVQ